MTSKRTKPVAVARETGSENVICLAANYVSENSLPLPALQAKFLRNRFGLEPERAAIIASLAWGGAHG